MAPIGPALFLSQPLPFAEAEWEGPVGNAETEAME